jgi:hypothetical protein
LLSVVRERIVTGMPTLSRRDLLYKCAATGALLGAAPFGSSFVEALLAAEQATKAPTPKNELGPFYRRAVSRHAERAGRSRDAAHHCRRDLRHAR